MQINLAPDASLLVIIAIFLANYWIVRKFFIQPINRIITEREQDVRGAERVYEQSLARFNEATADVDARLQQARKEASVIREAARTEAAQHRNEVLARTRTEAEGIVAAADRDLQTDVVTAKEKIQRDADALARLAAERILGRAL